MLQRHHFANKGPSSQGYGFSSSHVCMWQLDYKESWVPKNWCFWNVVLEKTLESLLDCKIKPFNPKGNQPWIYIGRIDAKASILWPPDAENWLTGKDRDARNDWETSLSLFTLMHWRRKLQPTPVFLPGESQGQWSLVGCHLWSSTELDMTDVTWQQHSTL